jgi:hypothetical protein
MPIYNQDPNIYFLPQVQDVTAITNAFPAAVTTYNPHQFVDGLWVRLDIPQNFGMTQANQLVGIITVTSTTTFNITIDTTLFDPFVVPPVQPGFNYTPAQANPIGDTSPINTGSFMNILTPLY